MDNSTVAHLGTGYMIQDAYSDLTGSETLGCLLSGSMGFLNEYSEIKRHPKHFAAVLSGCLVSLVVNVLIVKEKHKHPFGYWVELGTD